MLHTIALAQCTSTETLSENLTIAEAFAERASKVQAELLVFPEYFMTPYTLDDASYQRAAQPLNGSFVSALRAIARKYHIWIICGINEAASDSCKTYNTSVVINESGVLCGSYQKTHLFDAFHFKESQRTLPGTQFFTPIDTPFGRLGLGMCYDLRYPELARHAALSKAQLLIYPSAWVKGDRKAHQWETLLAARAIENGIFTVGCCFCSDTYLGQSRIIDPFGATVAKAGAGEELLIGHIDLEKVYKAKQAVPCLENRRKDLDYFFFTTSR